MARYATILIAFALVLTACAAPAAPASAPATTAVLPETGNGAATAYPGAAQGSQEVTVAATASPAGTEQPAVTAASTGSATIYQIDPSQSKVSYSVDEVFLRENNRLNTAVGVTQGISGTIQLDKSNPQNSQIGPITIDVSQFKSDSGQRDRMIQRQFLQSSQFPMATFKPTKIEGLPASIQEGTDYKLKVTGDLTVHQTTKPATFDVTVRLNGSTLTGQAASQVLMSDFGVGPISLMGMLKTNDEVKVTFDFVAVAK